MATYTIAIICPNCGGNAALAEGSRVVHCRYCNQKSLASNPLGYPTLYLPPQISPEDARLIAQKYILPEAEVEIVPLTFHQTQLLYVPFWRVQARIIGWVSGQAPMKREVIEESEEAEGSTYTHTRIVHTGGEPLKRMLVQFLEYTLPAAEVKELGVLRLTWEEKSLNFFPFKSDQAAGKGYLIDPTISPLKARREAETIFTKRVLAPYKNYTDFFHRLKLLPPHLTLFYYPLWLLTAMPYGNFNRRILDAVEGKVILAEPVYPTP